MEGRKWEELPTDCLVDVLGRVGMESLLLNVPFVCKSWYKATLNPFCWKQLHFPGIWRYSIDPFIIRFKRQYRLHEEICETKLVKDVIDRSGGCATMVELPYCYTNEALTYVAHKSTMTILRILIRKTELHFFTAQPTNTWWIGCPALKKLVLHSEEDSFMLTLSSVVGEFKNLESLEIESGFHFKDIVTEIGTHCQSFVALSLVAAAPYAYIGGEEVMAIVTCLPKIKCLALRYVSLGRENLIKILKGCVELVHLDVRDSCGFDDHDEELSKLASHIPTFECSGSVDFDSLGAYDYDDYYVYDYGDYGDYNSD